MKILIVASMLAFISLSCDKSPITDFSINKSEFQAGEVIKLTNTSQNGGSYKWTLPDGQNSSSFNVNYTIHSNTSPGVYTITLQSFSKKGDKSTNLSKNITVIQ
jgi:PKD repeat protein